MTYDEWLRDLTVHFKTRDPKIFTISSLPDILRSKQMIDTGIGQKDIKYLGGMTSRILIKNGIELSESQSTHNRLIKTYELIKKDEQTRFNDFEYK